MFKKFMTAHLKSVSVPLRSASLLVLSGSIGNKVVI